VSEPLYVLHPRYVVSRIDGDVHFIGRAALMRLYHIPASARVACDYGESWWLHWPEDAIHCWPRRDGDYPAPKEATRG